MMKFVFALVGLLHLCNSIKPNQNLNTEMIRRLETLNNSKVNFTSPNMVRVPSRKMKNNVLSCADDFFIELKHLLNNVTVHEDKNIKDVLKELKANLQTLGTQLEKANGTTCLMTQNRGQKPFETYANFLRKLNSSMKR